MKLLLSKAIDIDVLPGDIYEKNHKLVNKGKINSTSDKALREILKNKKDISQSGLHQMLFVVDGVPKKETFLNVLKEYFPKNSFEVSGVMHYPAGGYMGWHTNSNAIGIRCYFNYSENSNVNSFRYYDSEKDKIIDSYDLAGWNIRVFEVSKKDLLWHAVKCPEKRISIGFKLNTDESLPKLED